MASDPSDIEKIRRLRAMAGRAAQTLWLCAAVLRDREMSHAAGSISDLAEALDCYAEPDAGEAA